MWKIIMGGIAGGLLGYIWIGNIWTIIGGVLIGAGIGYTLFDFSLIIISCIFEYFNNN